MAPKLPPREEREWFYEIEDIEGGAARASEAVDSAVQAAVEGEEEPEFTRLWDELPQTSIARMLEVSLKVSDPRCADDADCRDFIVKVIRADLHWFWLTRRAARQERDQARALALEGKLGGSASERARVAELARALARRTGEGLRALAVDLPEEAYLLGYDAACQARAIGQLDDAYWLFQHYSTYDRIYPDDPLALPPREGRNGIIQVTGSYFDGVDPASLWMLEYFEAAGRVAPRPACKLGTWRRVVPAVKAVHWHRFDHVIGLGTTITPRIMDLLEVPEWKQTLIEVHRDVPEAVGRSFPALKGRVAVLDDVHLGETSLAVARLYRGDVINAVSPYITPLQSHYFHAPQPIASICNEEVDTVIGRKYRMDAEHLALRKQQWKDGTMVWDNALIMDLVR